MGEHLVPPVGRERARRLGDVTDDRHRAAQRAARGHLELHRREVLDLVDHDVAVRPDLVGVGGLAGLRRPWPEHLAGVVEQRDVCGRPAHVFGRLGAGSVERLVLEVLERAVAASRSRPVDPNRSCSNCAGVNTGQTRSSAARVSGSARTSSRDLTRRDFLTAAPRRRHRRPDLALDPAPGRVVTAEAAPRLLHDADRVVGPAAADSPSGTGRRGPHEAAVRRSRTALSITSLIRASPLMRAASGESPWSPRPAKRTSGTRSASTTCSTPASPSEGSTCSM